MPGKIDDQYVKDTCKLGQKELTCSFLMMGGSGFECAKGGPIEAHIRGRLAEGTMKAQGDNCDGI